MISILNQLQDLVIKYDIDNELLLEVMGFGLTEDNYLQVYPKKLAATLGFGCKSWATMTCTWEEICHAELSLFPYREMLDRYVKMLREDLIRNDWPESQFMAEEGRSREQELA